MIEQTILTVWLDLKKKQISNQNDFIVTFSLISVTETDGAVILTVVLVDY